MKHYLFLLSLVICIPAFAQKPRKTEKAFEVKENDLIPEGIACDPITGAFYIGSINKAKIVKVDAKGGVTDFVKSKAYGDWGFTGMKVDTENRVLWTCRSQLSKVADSAGYGGVFKFDLQTGQLLQKYIVRKKEASHLINDLVIFKNNVYVTDSDGGGIFIIRQGSDSLEQFIPAKTFIFPNGITISPDEKHLVVATSRGLMRIHMETKEITPLAYPSYFIAGIDGLYTYKGGLIGIQNVIFPESVNNYKISADAGVITGIDILSYNQPGFTKITTGTINGNYFYFIGNSHIDQLEKDASIKDPSKLRNLVIYKIKLD
jgi:hypothetical protein